MKEVDIVKEKSVDLIEELKLDQSVLTRRIVEIHMMQLASRVINNLRYETQKLATSIQEAESCDTTIIPDSETTKDAQDTSSIVTSTGFAGRGKAQH